MSIRMRAFFGGVLGVLIFAVCAWAGDDSGGWFSGIGNLVGGAMTGGVSSILGGVTGLVGNWLNAREERKRQERDHKHEQSMARIDQEGMKLEGELNIKREAVIAEGQIDTAIASSRVETVKSSNVGDGIFGLVERMLSGGWFARFFGSICVLQIVQCYVLVKLIRPALAIFCTTMFCLIIKDVKPQTTDTQLLYQALIYFMSTCLAFYFCERNRVSPPQSIAASPAGGGGSPSVAVTASVVKMPDVHKPSTHEDLSEEP